MEMLRKVSTRTSLWGSCLLSALMWEARRPADEQEWYYLLPAFLLRCLGHTAKGNIPVWDRGEWLRMTTNWLGVLTSTSLPHPQGALEHGAKSRRPKGATSIPDPSFVRKRMTFLVNTRKRLNESHRLSKLYLTNNSGDHIFLIEN